MPKRILSNNATPFINMQVGILLNDYGLDHMKSSPYYPQENYQAKATNKPYLTFSVR